MHPDLKEARDCLLRAHQSLCEARRLYQSGSSRKFNTFAAQQLRHYEKCYCRYLDMLWAVQERLGMNEGKPIPSYHHKMPIRWELTDAH